MSLPIARGLGNLTIDTFNSFFRASIIIIIGTMSNESIMEASQQDRPMAEGNVIIKRATLHASCLGIFVAKKHHNFNFENSKLFIVYCFLFLASKLALRLLNYFDQNQFGYIQIYMMMQTTIKLSS